VSNTTISIHTKGDEDPEKTYDALKRAMALIEELHNIPGVRVTIHGDLQVNVIPLPINVERVEVQE
jgi:hypothetical protein